MIDRKQVEHIAGLSRLALGEDEKELFGSQLNDILKYMETLNELDTKDIEPTSHVLDLGNVMRNDSPSASLASDGALGNAPDRSGNFYRVPRIIE